MKIEKINNLFRQLANWILRHRLIVGALFALFVAFSLVGAKRIVIRTSFDDYFLSDDPIPVSYTHLDVYKRQRLKSSPTSAKMKPLRRPHSRER